MSEKNVSPVRLTTSASKRRKDAMNSSRKPREERKERTTTDGMTVEMVRQRLLNPTRVVDEAELRAEYGYVLRDLRSIALLSAGLIVVLVVLAQVL